MVPLRPVSVDRCSRRRLPSGSVSPERVAQSARHSRLPRQGAPTAVHAGPRRAGPPSAQSPEPPEAHSLSRQTDNSRCRARGGGPERGVSAQTCHIAWCHAASSCKESSLAQRQESAGRRAVWPTLDDSQRLAVRGGHQGRVLPSYDRYSEAARAEDRLGAVGGLHLVEDVRDVVLHRLQGQAEVSCDLTIWPSCCE